MFLVIVRAFLEYIILIKSTLALSLLFYYFLEEEDDLYREVERFEEEEDCLHLWMIV